MNAREIGSGILLSFVWSVCLAGAQIDPPFWESTSITDDTLFFIQREGKPYAEASLLFVPKDTPALISATGDVTYQSGTDFIWEKGSRKIELTPGSRIPFKTIGEMYPSDQSAHAIGPARGKSGKSLLFGEGHFFHDLQLVAAYETSERWPGFVPRQKATLLPKTAARLKQRKTLRLTVLGDSISTGANASAETGGKPHRPAYPARVADGLKGLGASQVDLENFSVGGLTSAWGVTYVSSIVASAPDVVIVALGMNDAFDATPAEFGRNIRRTIDGVRKQRPDCEFILVAGMSGNPDWVPLKQESFPAFRDELRKLEGRGVAVADVTSVWADLLKRKTFHDLTGNGVNHPNDFAHKVYADVILKLLDQ
jgi:acyl-CoA thioesterase I